MSTKATDHHKKAAEHHEAENHEEAAYQVHTAAVHKTDATKHAGRARKAHADEHGTK